MAVLDEANEVQVKLSKSTNPPAMFFRQWNVGYARGCQKFMECEKAKKMEGANTFYMEGTK